MVGVVGSAHLDAVCRLFESASGFMDEVDDLLAAPAAVEDASLGTRRAILERLLSLRCPPEVAAEAVGTLGELSFAHAAAYEDTHEVYGSARMLLACLPREQLPAICGARDGADMWALLQPLRDARPANGGAGWSDAALASLRALTPKL